MLKTEMKANKEHNGLLRSETWFQIEPESKSKLTKSADRFLLKSNNMMNMFQKAILCCNDK